VKILPVNNTSFGYNKPLNEKLVSRLNETPYLPINRLLLEVNNNCNYAEEEIKKLEGEGNCDVIKNQMKINMLLSYFLDAKDFLINTVEKLFPDLNFLDQECATYELESGSIRISDETLEELEEIESDTNYDDDSFYEIQEAFSWRENLVDGILINKEIEEMQKSQTIDMKSALPLTHSKDNEGLVEEYTPYSYSPKSLNDVKGLKEQISKIKDLIIYPLEHPQEAKQRQEDYGIEIPHFTILYGPPGCGKTMLAQAIQAETNCKMYIMDISKIGSKYINETAINVKKAFEIVKREAKKSDKPILVFMDEMDSLLAKRSTGEWANDDNTKATNTLLQEIVAAKDNNIIILGATNLYDNIDNAVKDRARMELYIGLPNSKERMELIKSKLNTFKMGKKLAQDPLELFELSEMLKNYSPRTIINTIIPAASLSAYREKRELENRDFIYAIETQKPEEINESEYKPKAKVKNIGF